ncbi:Ube3a [Nucleospora cyclopteri]
MESSDLDLNKKCTNPNCLKIFCRPHSSTTEACEVFRLLNQSKEFFQCENIPTILKSVKTAKSKSEFINFYFYCTKLIYGNRKQEKFNPEDFSMKKPKALTTVNLNNKKKTRRNSISMPTYDVEHTFCQITSNAASAADIYIAVGIIHLMLQKFHISPNFLFGLIIIRLFNTLSHYENIDHSYYPIIYNVYNFIYHKMTSALIKFDLPEAEKCCADRCIFQLNFTRADFHASLKSISFLLDQCEPAQVRTSQRVLFLCEIHRILYNFNEELKIVDYENFYLSKFFSKIDIKEEYKHLKTKRDTVLVYKFMLPVEKKAELLKLENCDMQRNSLQDSFFRALFEGLTEPYLFITIKRETIYNDTIRILEKTPNEDLKKQLKISFLTEEGVDSGGIRKEFFQLLSHEIAHDKNLFVRKNNTIWLKRGADLNRLKIIGKIIGIALYNNVVLNIPFNSLFFKKFLNMKMSFDDLILIEPELHTSMHNLGKEDDSVFEDLGLVFTVEYEDSSIHVCKKLIKNGNTINVTKSNFDLYKRLFAQFYTEDLILNEFTELLDGFYSVIIGESIEGFNYHELEKIVVGINKIDFTEIRKSCIYKGYTKEAKVVQDFWRIVEGFSYDKQKKLLCFVTGNDRLPIGGAGSLKFTIMKNGCDTERLPSSQTCFNTLLIPEYVSYDKLKDKLETAIEMTAGFYLM